MAGGIAPTLAELVALRDAARTRAPARRGRFGASGQAQSPLRGRGMEYAESREYAQGDDARHIDWRVTARTGRAHTKLFQAERERLTLVVADTSPALYFGTRVRFKSVQAARAGAVAAWQAVRDGDRIAALRVLDALVRWYAAPPADDAGLDVALDHARRLLKPGSRVCVLADAASVVAVPAHRWAALAMHNEVRVRLLSDPLERDPPAALLPFTGTAPGDTARAGEARRIELDLASPAVRKRWVEAFDGPLQAALAQLAARGIRADVLSTDAASTDAAIGDTPSAGMSP